MRPECVQELGLPLRMNVGLIGSIAVDIPLAFPKAKPVVVRLRDVLVSLSPDPQRQPEARASEQAAARLGGPGRG